MRQFEKFCEVAGIQLQPDATALAQFVVGRAQHGYALSTIEQGVYAVSRWAQGKGVEGLAAALVVRQAMKVAAKLAVPAGRQKLPLDRQDLPAAVRVLQKQGARDFVGVRDRALFLVGWAGMFRSSELVGISWEDVREYRQGLLLYVPRSKTDQAREGAWVLIAICEQQEMCPVQAVRRLRGFARKGRDGQVTGPVFTSWPRGEEALSKGTVGIRLQKVLEKAGVDNWQQYAAHSLRRGGATWAVRQGVSVRQVMVMGRWKSDVVREYLNHSPAELWQGA
jgi:integrase